ncbi:MAG: hypothetical protein P8J91_08610 [Pirellulaceae bacterium]|nr:hypothetical protein [Pirellulaceae bacterium]
MNSSSSARPQKKWLTRKRIICFLLIIAATVYSLLQPQLEEWTGLDLPDFTQREVATSDAPKPPAVSGDILSDKTTFQLTTVDRTTDRSPAGLLYNTSGREPRVDHVMRHAQDDPKRDHAHGVFDGNTEAEVLAVLDNAYQLIQGQSNAVQREAADGDGRIAYTIDMPSRIGYVGGRAGAKQNNPATKRLKLVLAGKHVITAYPTWPQR